MNFNKKVYKDYKNKKSKNLFSTKRRGYILLEVVYSIFIAAIIMTTISTVATVSTTGIKKIDNRIELSEQANEIEYFIKKYLKNAGSIKFYDRNRQIIINEEFHNIDRIVTDEFSIDRAGIIESEVSYISINKSNKKIYIQRFGGKYEIGNYIHSMKVKRNIGGRTYNIEIELKKGNSLYADRFSIRAKNLLI